MQYLIFSVFGILFHMFLKQYKLGDKIKVLILILITLILLDFFGGYGRGQTVIIFFLIPFIFFEYHNISIFKRYIMIFMFGLFLSMLSSQYFRGQKIMTSLPVYTDLFAIIYYFFVKSLNPKIEILEKVLLVLIILFIGIYIISYFTYPDGIFSRIFIGEQRDYGEDVRIRIMGQGLASLGYFFALNKLLLQKRKNVLYIAILFACALIIFLMGFRTILAFLVPFTIYLVYKCYGFSGRLLRMSILSIIAIIIFINIPIIDEKINFILDRNKNENFQNEDYVRIAQFIYFTHDHFKNGIEYMLGSGLPQLGNEEFNIKASQYGIYMQGLVDNGINWVDFGLLSMSWMVGLLPIVTLIAYCIKAIRLNVRKEYLYVGIWFLFLVIISFTTMEAIRPGNLALHAIGLVLVELASKDLIIFKRKLKYINH